MIVALQNKRETVSESDSVVSTVVPGKNRSLDNTTTTEQPAYLLRVKVPDIAKPDKDTREKGNLHKDTREEPDLSTNKISKRFRKRGFCIILPCSSSSIGVSVVLVDPGPTAYCIYL